MANKIQPTGVCDCCLGAIPANKWFTSKKTPRLYCCRECRNTGNSRAGAAVRGEKAKKRVKAGLWQNPAELNPPDPQKISKGVSRARKKEVAEGRWRNPALTPEARDKLSKPRKHSGELHTAIKKLSQGTVDDLTESEKEAHRAYRRKLYSQRKDEIRKWHRQYYRAKQSKLTEEEKETQRACWRSAYQRRNKKTVEFEYFNYSLLSYWQQ